MNHNPRTLEYYPEHLLRLIDSDKVSSETKAWAKRELRLNGYLDYLDADNGEEPKQRV